MISKPNLSIWQMFALCMGAFGIQFCFALPQANATRIFQNLGASLEIIPLLWLAGPITGLIVQPLVGYYSDRTRTRIGRRRPYFLVGAALAAVMLIGWVEFEAESAVDGLMMRKIPFDGIVAASDLIALGGIRALHRAGVDVPRDVSVVGYDNNLLSR